MWQPLQDNYNDEDCAELWFVAWHTWFTVGHRITHAYLGTVGAGEDSPSQNFLTSLMRIFPLIYPKVSTRY